MNADYITTVKSEKLNTMPSNLYFSTNTFCKRRINIRQEYFYQYQSLHNLTPLQNERFNVRYVLIK